MPLHPHLADSDLAVRPVERAETIPSAWYCDPEFHALDLEAVFQTTWQYAGHVSRLASPGDHLAVTLAGHPVVVLRDGDGALRAFFNVCRHRGGPLVLCDGTGLKVLKCKYHGWTYRLDGTLRGVPAFDRTELFDKRDFGLVPLRLEVWEGLVFITMNAALPPLQKFMAGIAERIAPIRLESLGHVATVDYEVKANWKVYVDNYLEAYHVPHVHPELFTLYDFQRYTTEVHDYHVVQHSPVEPGDTGYGTGSGGMSWYFWIWPNLMLNILPGRLQTNLVLPVAADRCMVRFEYYYEDAASEATRARARDDHRFSDEVQREDIQICERVQLGLASPAYDRGRFSVDYEQGVWRFHSLLKGAYRAWLDDARATGSAAS